MSSPSTTNSFEQPRLWSFTFIDGKSYLGAVAKRGYRIRHGDRPVPESALPVDAGSDLQASFGPDASPSELPGGDALNLVKPTTDVVLSATAHSPHGPTSYVDTAIRLGPVVRHVRAWGERKLERAPGCLQFGPAEPFQSVSLTWALAYGGGRTRSKRAAPRPRYAYPRNPFGRGFHASERGDIQGEVEVPRLEDPFEPILPSHLAPAPFADWGRMPLPAGYAAIHPLVFPRSTHLHRATPGGAADAAREIALGALDAADLGGGELRPPSARLANAAAPGMARARLTGGERVELTNLHPRHAHLAFDLPGDVPRFSVDLPGVGPREMRAELGTVYIEPDRDRVVLTWAGRLEVAWPYPDDVLEGLETRVVWPRPLG